MALADCIASTVIVATMRVTITGADGVKLPNDVQDALFASNGPPNPVYRKNAYCIASVVIGWLGMVFSFAR